MSVVTPAPPGERAATIEDLYAVEGKAELVNGRIVRMAPTGDESSSAGFSVAVRLREYQQQTGTGRAYTDNVGYRVTLPNRGSFSPDASFYTGPRTGLRYLNGAPVFAVEVRSENDYGPAAEAEQEAKRLDYFNAGTQIVWDVDLRGADVVRKFAAPNATTPAAIFRTGDIADAEPALPGWRIPVDELFL